MMAATPEPFCYLGCLQGHSNWVTSLACSGTDDLLMSTSRDKTCIVWDVSPSCETLGDKKLTLSQHRDAVSSCVLSACGNFALTGSWDKTMLLWDLTTGDWCRKFEGHRKDVNSVAFSADNRMIISGSRDKTIKLWNTLAECKYTITEENHTDWISSVAFIEGDPLRAISAGWDKAIKIWSMTTCKLKKTISGHAGHINSLVVSPDNTLCFSGATDGTVKLWELSEQNEGNPIRELRATGAISTIYGLACNVTEFLMAVATEGSVHIWDLESRAAIAELPYPTSAASLGGIPAYASVAWSGDGKRLFAGSTDGGIHVYQRGETHE